MPFKRCDLFRDVRRGGEGISAHLSCAAGGITCTPPTTHHLGTESAILRVSDFVIVSVTFSASDGELRLVRRKSMRVKRSHTRCGRCNSSSFATTYLSGGCKTVSFLEVTNVASTMSYQVPCESMHGIEIPLEAILNTKQGFCVS